MKKIFLTLLLLSSLPFLLFSQEKVISYLYDAGSAVPATNIRIDHLQGDLKIDAVKKRIDAVVIFNFKMLRSQVDSVVFELGNVKINSVKMAGSDNKWTDCQWLKNGRQLVVFNPFLSTDVCKIRFDYLAEPAEGIYFIGWNDAKNIKRKQVWAHRPNGWLPYTDSRLTVDMRITFDNHFKVYFNGELKSAKDNGDGSKTWNYIMTKPHPFFSTALAIGDYAEENRKTADGIPLQLLYYPALKNRVEPTYRYSEAMFGFYKKEMGLPYPWPLYRQIPVIDYMYGAMETTTSTIFADFFQVDERCFLGRNYINVNAHELAHQWFGNYISHLAAKDVWLTESFGTYYAKIFEKSVFGEDYYQNVRNTEYNRVMAAAEKDNNPVAHSNGNSDRWYNKGSLILDMLRYVMGDEEFKATISYYLKQHPYSSAETSDFFTAVRTATGYDLNWFFDEWILRGGEPNYKLTWKSLSDEAGKAFTHISVSQLQPVSELTGYFKMPIVFEVHYTDGSFDSKKEMIAEKDETVMIPNPLKKTVAYILFDPDRNILKKVTFDRPLIELSAQAGTAINMIDRYDALVAMRPFPLKDKRKLMVSLYKSEKFHLTKSEIISQLATDTNKMAFDLMVLAINDPDAMVRKAVVLNVVNVPVAIAEAYKKLLSDSAYSVIELALDNLCRSFPEKTPGYLEITKNEIGWRGKNVRIKWLEISAANHQQSCIDSLVRYTSESYEFETRINAMNALKRQGFLNEEVIGNLFEAYLHWNFKLNNAAKDILAYFVQQSSYNTMINKVYLSDKWTDAEKELLKKALH